MPINDKDLFGIRVNPIDLLAAVFNEATMTAEGGSAKGKPREFDVKAHLDNLAAAGQGFFESFGVPGFSDEKKDAAQFTPAVDVLASETGVEYLVGAPGVRPDEVSVELEDSKLTISISAAGIISSSEHTNNWKGGLWSQSFNVPTGDSESPKHIDEESISAKVTNGLISVRISYKAPKVTKIKVA